MDKEQLLDLLRDHLTVEVCVARKYFYENTQHVIVRLLFDGEEIYEDYDSLPDCDR